MFFDLFRRRPAKISLLHATRGRPELPLRARQLWLDAAQHPDRIEHIFAIDSDDTLAREALASYQPRVVEQLGLGCVGAWNLAAQHSTGDILVQLSDDWLPVQHWDTLFDHRIGTLKKPRVLVVSDGHRTDDLLCMAILNRKRYQQQGFFLSPSYTGVYSDDEFSFRAYEDQVIVQARDIVLTHQHPNYDPTVAIDETYAQQNHESKYAGAKAIFLERNPEAKKRWFVKGDWAARKWQPQPTKA
jgi:hypothetical protein